MADFGSMFDSAKDEEDKKRAETRALLEKLQSEKKEKLDAGMRPLNEIVDPVFQAAAAQLLSKGVRLKRDVSSKLIYEHGERKPARNYQFQLGHNKPGSTYHFDVYPGGYVTCTVSSYENEGSSHHSRKQIMRCKTEELTPEKVEEIVRAAIEEVARSK